MGVKPVFSRVFPFTTDPLPRSGKTEERHERTPPGAFPPRIIRASIAAASNPVRRALGCTLLSGGRGTVTGTLFGVLIFTVLTNVFTLNNLSISAQAVAKGVIIVIAVLLQQRIANRTTT